MELLGPDGSPSSQEKEHCDSSSSTGAGENMDPEDATAMSLCQLVVFAIVSVMY